MPRWTSDRPKAAAKPSGASRRTVNSSRGVRVEKCLRYFTRRSGYGCWRACYVNAECRHADQLMRDSRILQKHIKRQIISLNGGFQVIADLNAYHAFIASLKVCVCFFCGAGTVVIQASCSSYVHRYPTSPQILTTSRCWDTSLSSRTRRI